MHQLWADDYLFWDNTEQLLRIKAAEILGLPKRNQKNTRLADCSSDRL
jgi:hypothetical protein